MNKLPQNWRILFAVIAVILLFSLIWLFRAILAYVIIAVVVAFICEPLADLLKKIRFKKFMLPSWFRALFSLMFFFSVFFGLIFLFTPLVNQEIQIISEIDPVIVSEKIQQQFYGIQGGSASGFLSEMNFTESIVTKAQEVFSFEWIQSFFNSLFGLVGGVIIGFFAVVFIAFFFLKDGFLFARIVFTVTPEKYLEKIKNIMEHTHSLLRRYFIGLAIQSLIMAVLVGVSLSLLGVQNAVLIGLFAGIVNIVPYIGPLMGAAVGVLIALTTSIHLDFQTAILPLLWRVLSVFVVAQQIDAFVVQPLILGNSVKAHPLEIFIVVLMAGTVGGVLGMVLAIPVYTILRVIAKEFLSEFRAVKSLTRDLTD